VYLVSTRSKQRLCEVTHGSYSDYRLQLYSAILLCPHSSYSVHRLLITIAACNNNQAPAAAAAAVVYTAYLSLSSSHHQRAANALLHCVDSTTVLYSSRAPCNRNCDSREHKAFGRAQTFAWLCRSHDRSLFLLPGCIQEWLQQI